MVLVYNDFKNTVAQPPDGVIIELKSIIEKAVKFNISQKGNFNFNNFLLFVFTSISSWQVVCDLTDNEKIKLNVIKNLVKRESMTQINFGGGDIHKINTFLKMLQDLLCT